VFDRYIATKTGIRDTTKSNYIYTYNQYVRDGFGNRKIADIKYSDVLAFYLSLMKERGLTVSTVDSVHCILRPTFQLAFRDDIIRKNPCEGAMAEVKKCTNNKTGVRHALTLEEQTAFLDYIENTERFRGWLPLFTVMLGTGMRIGEVLGLRWEDIDLDRRRISVNHTLVYYQKDYGNYRKSVLEISLPKTPSGIRHIPIIDSVRDAFLEMKDVSEALGGCTSEIDGYKDFIFFNRYREVQKAQPVNDAIHSICENYNAEETIKAARESRDPLILPYFTNHHLRHTFCSRLCEADINLKVIQMIMGHKDIQTTMDIYAEVSEFKKHESMIKFAEMFKNIF
jgi:integrase